MSDELANLREEIAAFIRDPKSQVLAELARRADELTPEPDTSTPLGPLEQAAFEASWARFCLTTLSHPPILALVPPEAAAEIDIVGSSIDSLLVQSGNPDSFSPLRGRGLDARSARSFLASRQRDRQPILIVAPTTLLDQLIGSLERFDLRFRLSPSSVVVEIVDGNLATDDTSEPRDRYRLATEFLAIPSPRIVRQLSLPTVTPLFTDVLQGGDPEVFVAPHWVQFGVVDPDSNDLVEGGQVGLLQILDLANLHRGHRIDTKIRVRLDANGVRLNRTH